MVSTHARTFSRSLLKVWISMMEAATGSTEKYWGRGREAAQGGADPSSAHLFPISWAKDNVTGKVKLSWGRFYREEVEGWHKRSLKRRKGSTHCLDGFSEVLFFLVFPHNVTGQGADEINTRDRGSSCPFLLLLLKEIKPGTKVSTGRVWGSYVYKYPGRSTQDRESSPEGC